MPILTAREKEQARQQALAAARKRLEVRKPDLSQYGAEESQAARIIAATLIWAKAFVPLVALLGAVASAIRTVQTVSEIYTASGSAPIGVTLAAVAFTLSAEGALFVLALAQEGQRMQWRAARQPRHVTSAATLWRGLLVRLGRRPPLRWDEMPDQGGSLNAVIGIAFAFTVASNFYLGMRPVLFEIGSVSLQTFLANLVNAAAPLQVQFITDLAAVFFPPLMSLSAGHLTAHFAAEIASGRERIRAAYEADLARWRDAYADPLNTDEGREILAEYIADKEHNKLARRPTPTPERHDLPRTNGQHMAVSTGNGASGASGHS